MSTIFIQIASYKDPQLIPTLDDCIKNAKHPENFVQQSFSLGIKQRNQFPSINGKMNMTKLDKK